MNCFNSRRSQLEKMPDPEVSGNGAANWQITKGKRKSPWKAADRDAQCRGEA